MPMKAMIPISPQARLFQPSLLDILPWKGSLAI
jgi:hypothetical protein